MSRAERTIAAGTGSGTGTDGSGVARIGSTGVGSTGVGSTGVGSTGAALPAPRRGGPLARVLAAVAEGTPTVAAIAQRCDLDRGTVEAAIEQLVRLGRLERSALGGGCPPQGCGGCSTATGSCGVGVGGDTAHDAAAGHGGCGPQDASSPAPARRQGLVALSLRRR